MIKIMTSVFFLMTSSFNSKKMTSWFQNGGNDIKIFLVKWFLQLCWFNEKKVIRIKLSRGQTPYPPGIGLSYSIFAPKYSKQRKETEFIVQKIFKSVKNLKQKLKHKLKQQRNRSRRSQMIFFFFFCLFSLSSTTSGIPRVVSFQMSLCHCK